MRVHFKRRSRPCGFSLAEALASLAVSLVTIGGLVGGFLQSAQESEWSAYSLAAQAQALRGLEQVRAANRR